MSGTEQAAGRDVNGGARRVIDTSVAHSARVHDLVPVQRWRPASAIEAEAHSAMWGGVGRKPQG